MSNLALWATITAPPANSRNIGSTAAMVGQLDDLRRDAALRVDQGGELAQHHAAADFDRADLGDRVSDLPVDGCHATAGGLQVDNDESGFLQRYLGSPVEVGEAQLLGNGRAHGGDVNHSYRQGPDFAPRRVATRRRRGP
jgi:hypothetical protein